MLKQYVVYYIGCRLTLANDCYLRFSYRFNTYIYVVKQDDINTLVPLLNGVTAEWNKFGVYLPVHFDDIKNIKRGGPITDVKDCLNDVLDWYSKKQGPKKWTDIVKALKDIRNFDLASRIPQTGDG